MLVSGKDDYVGTVVVVVEDACAETTFFRRDHIVPVIAKFSKKQFRKYNDMLSYRFTYVLNFGRIVQRWWKQATSNGWRNPGPSESSVPERLRLSEIDAINSYPRPTFQSREISLPMNFDELASGEYRIDYNCPQGQPLNYEGTAFAFLTIALTGLIFGGRCRWLLLNGNRDGLWISSSILGLTLIGLGVYGMIQNIQGPHECLEFGALNNILPALHVAELRRVPELRLDPKLGERAGRGSIGLAKDLVKNLVHLSDRPWSDRASKVVSTFDRFW